MPKNFKIILILSAVAITAILVLVIVLSQNSENNFFKKIGDRENSEEKVDLVALGEEYKEEIAGAFAEFEELEKTGEFDEERLEEIRNETLNLKMPAEFKDLHLNFILALTRMEDYIKTGSEDTKIAAEELIGKIKNNYPWVYNTNTAN